MSTEPTSARALAVRGALGAGLLLAGLLCLALWRVLSGTENLAFTEGAGSPPAAHVTEGDTYSLAVPGGAPAMVAHGVFGATGGPLSLSCEWSEGGSPTQSLSVTPENTDTKAETTVARFAAPVTGDIRVTCANWGPVFISDADDVGADTSGWFLVAAVITLTAGIGFALSAAREVSLRSSGGSGGSGEDDQVQRYVDLRDTDGQNGEVRDFDARDVSP
jgi:hypothetical protein